MIDVEYCLIFLYLLQTMHCCTYFRTPQQRMQDVACRPEDFEISNPYLLIRLVSRPASTHQRSASRTQMPLR